ncbi:MAG: tyrosine-type recombinase/integrase [Planctomycetes bacterium]|nr:tyrosine-type recombinase/integrase [Planctomycetota bacterium]
MAPAHSPRDPKTWPRRSDAINTGRDLPAGLTPHDLRRTYVPRWVRAGVPLPAVQKPAGHSSIRTTVDYYNWVHDDDLRACVAKLAVAAG